MAVCQAWQREHEGPGEGANDGAHGAELRPPNPPPPTQVDAVGLWLVLLLLLVLLSLAVAVGANVSVVTIVVNTCFRCCRYCC